MSEYASVENTLDLKKFLPANRAYREFVAAAFVCLVDVLMCYEIHIVQLVACKSKSKFQENKIKSQ